MELTELQKRFAPKECETQIEFERLMSELQEENTKKSLLTMTVSTPSIMICFWQTKNFMNCMLIWIRCD